MVLLMDKDNVEMFYSKVFFFYLKEVFYCLESYLTYIINEEQPLDVQIQRACELSNTVMSIFGYVVLYRNEHHI
jgi:nuclear pore complex protein Nup133